MLYYELTKRLSIVSISLTSGIKANSGVLYGSVAQAQTKIIRIGTKMQDTVVRKVANLSHTQNKRNKRDIVFKEK